MTDKPKSQPPRKGERKDTFDFRFGRFATVEHRDPNQQYDDYPEIQTILLAEVYEDGLKKKDWPKTSNKRVWFWRMRAWQGNNKTIGYASLADGCNPSEIKWDDPSDIIFDPWLRKCKKNAVDITKAIIEEYRSIKAAGDGGAKRKGQIPLPEAPVDRAGIFLNRRLDQPACKKNGRSNPREIDVIALVRVYIEDVGDLEEVDHMVLAGFDETDTLDKVKTYFLDDCEWKSSDPDKSERRVGLRSLLDHDDYDLEIWVLPQAQDNLNMYNWGASPSYSVREFTEHDLHHEEEYEALYVEARVVAKNNDASKAAQNEDVDNANGNRAGTGSNKNHRGGKGSAAKKSATSGRPRGDKPSAPRQRDHRSPVTDPRDLSPVRSETVESIHDEDA